LRADVAPERLESALVAKVAITGAEHPDTLLPWERPWLRPLRRAARGRAACGPQGPAAEAGRCLSGSGRIWTRAIGDQLLTFSELTGRLSFASSGGGVVPEIDPVMGGSALSLVAGVLAMLEQRRRRRRSAPSLAA